MEAESPELSEYYAGGTGWGGDVRESPLVISVLSAVFAASVT